MSTYFKPLRRKNGVVALVIAGMFAAAWARSFVTKDTFQFQIDSRTIWLVVSNRSRILFRKFKCPHPTAIVQEFHESEPVRDDDFESYFNEKEFVVETRWKAAGFEFGETLYRNFNPPAQNELWFIPYWSIVIPLIALSAWLFVSKPRNQQKSATTVA